MSAAEISCGLAALLRSHDWQVRAAVGDELVVSRRGHGGHVARIAFDQRDGRPYLMNCLPLYTAAIELLIARALGRIGLGEPHTGPTCLCGAVHAGDGEYPECEACETFRCVDCARWVPWVAGADNEDEAPALCDECAARAGSMPHDAEHVS